MAIRLTPLIAASFSALVLCTTVGSATSAESRQRVMLEQEHKFGASRGTFALSVLTEGRLESDAGTYTYSADYKGPRFRQGQGIAVYDAVETLKGRRGTVALEYRVEFVGAGAGNTVGTGTWSVTGGTGAYRRLRGGGRLATVLLTGRGSTSIQFEGMLRASARADP